MAYSPLIYLICCLMESNYYSSLIQTKLNQPLAPVDLVSRPQLLKRLNQQDKRPFTLITAPAGYGKSTLVSCWIDTLDQPSIWLSLDEYDSDFATFITYFVSAIQTRFPDAGQSVLQMVQGVDHPQARVIAGSLLNDLNKIETPFVFVLDDYHLIQETAVHEFIIELLRYPSPAMHLVICTRCEPPLPIAVMQGRNEIVVVRSDELRFSVEETTVFLHTLIAAPLNDDSIVEMNSMTEGWVTGLRLLALSLRQQAEPDAYLAALPHSPRVVTEYLMGAVFDQLDADVKAFLLQTAVLDRLCAPLCDAVTQTGDGHQFLKQLQDANLFLIPLDDQREWVRYHYLFQQHLQQQLADGFAPEAIAALHSRASKWFADNGLIDEALAHAFKAGDVKTAVSLIAADRHNLIDRELFHHLELRFNLFDPQTAQQYPQLQIIEVWLHNVNARFVEELAALDRTESLLAQADLPPEIADPIRGEICVFRANVAIYFSGKAPLEADVACALALLPRKWSYAYTGAQMVKGTSYMIRGQMAEAETYLQQQLIDSELRQIRHNSMLMFGLMHVYWYQLKLSTLAVSAADYLQHGQAHQLSGSISLANYYLGCPPYQQNQLSIAQAYFTDAANADYILSTKFYLQAICGLILIDVAQGEFEKAAVWLKTGRDLLETRQNRGLAPFLDGCAAEIAMAQGDLPTAVRWATVADPYQFDGFSTLYLPQITWAKVMLAQNRAAVRETVAAFLSHSLAIAAQTRRLPELVSLLSLQALLAEQMGEGKTAVSTLKEAVMLAQPAGAVRFIADMGTAVKPLLLQLRQQEIAPYFIDDILAAILPAPVTNKNSPLNEPLTEREMDVLALLAQRLSNKEIGQKLFISAGTVSQHTNHIYKKLGVSNRKTAVVKAKELQIGDFRTISYL